jgi:hypothetical protein
MVAKVVKKVAAVAKKAAAVKKVVKKVAATVCRKTTIFHRIYTSS